MKRLFLKIALLTAIIYCAIPVLGAQNLGYKTAIGWRFGVTQGLTIKTALRNDAAFEGIIALWPYSMGVTGLYEVHKSTGTRDLNWYYGAGAHINWTTHRNYYFRHERRYFVYEPRTAFGLDGIIGLELHIPRSPIAISLDIKPTFNFYNDGGAYAFLDPGLGLKFGF